MALKLRLGSPSPVTILALVAAAVAAAPLVGLLLTALEAPAPPFARPELMRYALNSAALTLGVGIVTGLIGGSTAWLVTLYRFPGRGLFAWTLVLPLAAPGFAFAYAYADLLDVGGQLRSWWRDALGSDLTVSVRSLAGAVFVLSLAFYPYVYLGVRAALINRSATALEAARLLGAGRWRVLFGVALPLIRPALAAGMALAMMETLADYGASRFLDVQTLTTGVVRAWSVFGSPAGAAGLALPLVGAAAMLLLLEQIGRKGLTADGVRRETGLRPLSGWRSGAAAAACILLLVLALAVPLGWLALRAADTAPEWSRLWTALRHSSVLAVLGAVLTTGLGAALALASARFMALSRLTGLGYATPGAAIAIGLLAPVALLWRAAPELVGSLAAGVSLLLLAYAARLMAAALEPIQSSLTRTPPSVVEASRLLGRSRSWTALRVRLPLAVQGLLVAFVLVFLDVLKELPATLILRPFNFDTLAVIADNYARDERLANAAWPVLLIVLAALPLTLWLTFMAMRPAQQEQGR